MEIHNKIAPSATVAINTLAQQKKAKGEEVFNFSAGDPNLPMHPDVAAGVSQALQSQDCSYPPLMGLPALRTAVANWLNSSYGCHYKEGQILVTCGGKFALYAALDLLLSPGDEVLIPSPFWPSYPTIVGHFNGIPVNVPTKETNGWKVTPDELKKMSTPKTKVLILNQPNNPTGAIYSREELMKILELAEEQDWTVISDEVYSEILYDQEKFVSCGSFPQWQNRVVVIQSCSKNFGMTGLRVGFALGPEQLIAAMASLQGQTTTGTSSLSQWAALSAIKHAHAVSSTMRTAMQEKRDHFMDTLNRLFSCDLPKPPSALYAFVPLSVFAQEKISSQDFCEKILREANIATVPGSAFGMEGYVRFAFTESLDHIERGLNALKRLYAQ
ncbi:MAG: aminotransferase class I/II-fold pyridoxal phosphate-dependent enzyme [Verrucomicrobia bacterium]|nr:aminotransferase class I/II-fold pyridoxal phosphate-dependent enzyme [Verrucomicrobiota bacterium]